MNSGSVTVCQSSLAQASSARNFPYFPNMGGDTLVLMEKPLLFFPVLEAMRNCPLEMGS